MKLWHMWGRIKILFLSKVSCIFFLLYLVGNYLILIFYFVIAWVNLLMSESWRKLIFCCPGLVFLDLILILVDKIP